MPNSGLGKAISYLTNQWPKPTLFLRQAGVPLDNNTVERALKKAILNRKNARFYKTLNGAGVGDLFMSLIHTCELNGANPFDYLTELQHAEEAKQTLSEWTPWNYRETLAQLATPAAAKHMMNPDWPKRSRLRPRLGDAPKGSAPTALPGQNLTTFLATLKASETRFSAFTAERSL